MPTPPIPESAAEPATRLRSVGPALLIAAAACAAWSNSFSGPFVFDDRPSIADNPTILQLWPPEWLHPPGRFGETVGGRPLLNLSFALNHALGGQAVGGFHATNLAIHVLAALALFGLVRRTLLLPRCSTRLRGNATPLALAVAALWALHPLQTAAVTYIVQRAESLASLFYLLTLYAFVRAAQRGSRRTWSCVSVIACVLGVATKETVATAPLLALLLDRALIAGSFREAWRARGRLLVALAACWLLVAALAASTGGRGGTAGFGSKVGVWPYLLTQAQAVVRYLGLAFWPSPLVFDYGASTVHEAGAVLPQAILLLLLLGATLVALVRRSPAGLLGAWFFVILAPTSSIVPVATQTIAEHRMYLPLAAVIAGAVFASHRFLGRAAFGLFLLCGLALGVATWQRNTDYRTEQALWADTIAKHPENARIHTNAGHFLLVAGRPGEAIPYFMHALELDPHLASAKVNLGNALRETGHAEDAVPILRAVVAEDPGDATARVALGTVLVDLQRPDEAIAEYREAMRLAPDTVTIRTNLAAVLVDQGAAGEALALLRAAMARNPRVAQVHFHMGRALLRSGDAAGGIEHLREAIRLKPALPVAHFELGEALAGRGEFPAAIEAYRQELALDPSNIPARNNLATALVRSGRIPEAIREFEVVLQAQPDNASVRHNLEYARQLQQGAPPK